MKNKKGQTIYSEPIFFPCEFRAKTAKLVVPPMTVWMDKIDVMPCLLTGWVQNEVHLQVHHQSLN